MRDEFKENDYDIVSIITDNRKEFKNKEFLNHYSNIKDKIFFKDAELYNGALSIVDRVIRTIRN